MNYRDFVYWLQGFFEISGSKTLTEAQVAMIKQHLGYVFAQPTVSAVPTQPQVQIHTPPVQFTPEQLRFFEELAKPDFKFTPYKGPLDMTVTC